MTKTIILNVKGNSVTRQMTEAQIKSLGGSRFVRRKVKYWLTLFGLCVVWAIIGAVFFKRSISTDIIIILPIVVVFVAFYYSYIKAGKRFWNVIKDKEEPVELD